MTIAGLPQRTSIESSTLERTRMTGNKLDYELQQQIATQSSASNRGLVVRLGVSEGKINYCLRALVDKVWVKANSFLRGGSNAFCRPGRARNLHRRAGFILWV